MNDQRRWYAGIDWGSQSHTVFLTDSDGRRIGEKIFPHSAEGLAEMATWLQTESGASHPDQTLLAIEIPHGPVVEAMLERGFAVHAINPRLPQSPYRRPSTGLSPQACQRRLRNAQARTDTSIRSAETTLDSGCGVPPAVSRERGYPWSDGRNARPAPCGKRHWNRKAGFMRPTVHHTTLDSY